MSAEDHEESQHTRYGGTPSPCDDPHPCEVGARTGFHIRTRISQSRIPGAGLGRFVEEAVSANTVIRTQILGSRNLLAFRSEEELLKAFPLPQDIAMLADFGFGCSEHEGVVMLDAPPTMVNHASSSLQDPCNVLKDGEMTSNRTVANTAFQFSGDRKTVVAIRDIAAGEELLQDYRDQVRVPYFEKLLEQAQLQSARQLGEYLR